jgi:nicotinamide-nucleotide amidase
MASNKVSACCKALIAKKWTITFVESASAGKMSYEFSTVPNSGKILIGGMVCYHSRMKEEVLGIPSELIETYTAESAEVTKAMANNFCKFIEADVCIALTGLTTPGGSETPQKPVGTIFVHLILPDKQIAKRFNFTGEPDEILVQAIDETATLLLDEIE